MKSHGTTPGQLPLGYTINAKEEVSATVGVVEMKPERQTDGERPFKSGDDAGTQQIQQKITNTYHRLKNRLIVKSWKKWSFQQKKVSASLHKN